MRGHCRFALNGEASWGYIDEGVVYPTTAFGERPGAASEARRLDDVRLLAPSRPSKVMLISKNYRERVAFSGADAPTEPLLFLKPPTAVIGPGDHILLPPDVGDVTLEMELAAIVGRRAKGADVGEAESCILGYTILLDLSARDLVARDVQFTRGKGFDTFAPLGPVIAEDVDPQDVRMRAWLNGELVNEASTSDMIFPVVECVAFASGVMTLEPGDVIATGGAGAPRPVLQVGDEIAVEAEGIGTLVVTVAAAGRSLVR